MSNGDVIVSVACTFDVESGVVECGARDVEVYGKTLVCKYDDKRECVFAIKVKVPEYIVEEMIAEAESMGEKVTVEDVKRTIENELIEEMKRVLEEIRSMFAPSYRAPLALLSRVELHYDNVQWEVNYDSGKFTVTAYMS